MKQCVCDMMSPRSRGHTLDVTNLAMNLTMLFYTLIDYNFGASTLHKYTQIVLLCPVATAKTEASNSTRRTDTMFFFCTQEGSSIKTGLKQQAYRFIIVYLSSTYGSKLCNHKTICMR